MPRNTKFDKLQSVDCHPHKAKYVFNTICHDIEDEKQWTGRNVSRAQKHDL